MLEAAIQVGLLALGFFMLVKGADWLVDGAVGIALSLGIPQLVIGLTVVSMGTSLPEAAVSIAGAIKGSAEIAVGNVLGSNIINILIILGLSSSICALRVVKTTKKYEIPFMLLCSLIFVALGLDGMLTRIDGLAMWGLFVLSWFYLAKSARESKEEGIEDDPNIRPRKVPLWKLSAMVLGGAGIIALGSDFAVDAAVKLAEMAGVSERLIALTIIALGTSLPELFTSVTAARRGNSDISIGNIVGSVTFNILFVAGTSAVITDVPYAESFRLDSAVSIAAPFLLFLFILKDGALKRPAGIVLLACYAVYFAVMFFTQA